MRLEARFQTVIEVLDAIADSSRGADFEIQKALRERRYMGSKDRRAVKGYVYDILRNWGMLCWRLGFDPSAVRKTQHRLLCALFLEETDFTPEEIFTGEGHAPAVLKLQELAALGKAQPKQAAPEWARLSVPEWLLTRFQDGISGEPGVSGSDAQIDTAQIDADLASVLSALNQPAALDVRLLGAQERTEYMAHCEARELSPVATRLSNCGVRFQDNVPAGNIPGYSDGQVIIQDEGSQLVAQATLSHFASSDLAGGVGWDVCAGGGGKTLSLMDMLPDGARLLATDVAKPRISEATKRLAKSGFSHVQSGVLPAGWESPDFDLGSYLDQLIGQQSVDWALIDAPCSGIGAWRRAPFSRWRLWEDRLLELTQIQEAILNAVAQCLNVGGVLTYATCSLLPEENEHQVQRFLERHPNYAIASLKPMWQGILQQDSSDAVRSKAYGDVLTLRPDVHETDGFFVASFRRIAK